MRTLILGGDVGTPGDPEADAELKDVLRMVAVIARQVAFSEGRWAWWPESEKLTTYLGPP